MAGSILATLSLLTITRLPQRPLGMFLYPIKALVSGLAPLLAGASALLALIGLRRRDPWTAAAGLLAAGTAARYIVRSTASHDGFAQAFGASWQAQLPAELRPQLQARRWSPALRHFPLDCQRNVCYGRNPETGQDLLADLYRPPAGVAPTGMGIIYVHGGAWRIGARDMGTRAFFGQLAGQGHLILDIEYTLAPHTDMSGMVRDVKRAIVWLKTHAEQLGVRQDRIVLIGGSAGGHLVLVAAYSPNDPAFQPDGSPVDTSVHGVVSFYPPADLLDMYADVETARHRLIVRKQRFRPYGRFLEAMLQRWGLVSPGTRLEEAGNLIADLVGAEPWEDPVLYRALSPTGRVGPHCPPTLLLQGTADIFGMAPPVRRLHQALQRAEVPVVLVELTDTDHAFDLFLAPLSPPAQAATYDVERFLALLL